VLGPFEVRTDDGVLADVPGARLRALLVALALETGHTVPKAMLVDWIWGERPPSEAGHAPLIAQAIVEVADLAPRRDEHAAWRRLGEARWPWP
jgi:hypothetical protein